MKGKKMSSSIKPNIKDSERNQKQAQDETRLLRSYFNALLEHNPLAVVSLDMKHNIISCNPAFEKLFQYKEKEVVGKNLYSLYPYRCMPIQNTSSRHLHSLSTFSIR